MNAILGGKTTLQKNILLFILCGSWPKITSTSLPCAAPFVLKYNSHLIFVHFLRWIVSPSSSRVIEFCTGRLQDCPLQDTGSPKMSRSLLSAALSSLLLRRALCMRSRSGLISMSFRAWTVNPGRHGLLRKV